MSSAPPLGTQHVTAVSFLRLAICAADSRPCLCEPAITRKGRVAQVLILLTLSTQWVPRPSRFLRRAGTTNVCSGAELGHSMAERNLRPALVHAHRP
jgi:hypothetical protein